MKSNFVIPYLHNKRYTIFINLSSKYYKEHEDQEREILHDVEIRIMDTLDYGYIYSEDYTEEWKSVAEVKAEYQNATNIEVMRCYH